MPTTKEITLLATLIGVAACSDSTSPNGTAARVRVINSIFQGASAVLATPVAIDVMIDSSATSPSLSGLAANSISAGNVTIASTGSSGAAAGAAERFTAAGYRDIATGIHSFVVRVAGTSGPTSTVFRNAAGTGEYLPRQFITPFPYTFVVAGIVPVTGTAASPSAVPYIAIVEDPFTPPADPTGGLTSRVRIINAAPFAVATGGGASIVATFAGIPGTFTATAAYRTASPYVNPPAATYMLTITTGTTTLYSANVTLAKGEVRTFVVQSASNAGPSPGNTNVTNLLDNQW